MNIDSKIMTHVKNILLTFGNRYIENDNLKRNKVIQDLDNYDLDLISSLLSDDLIRKSYTEKVLDTEIFKINQFIEMLEYKEFWEDSYTKYQNKIGLTTNGKFIDDSSDVVLDFPFKDTVLKAGMSKEDLDKDENVDEVFLNEIIAKAEIDELLEPKILVNAKKYDETGIHNIDDFNIDDNLILKGNNLIALHSIKKRYAGKIKCIFLDPPYNTGTDSFPYNDRFNRSSWLTFIKNRLEVAKELLAEDGVLLVQISVHSYPYLRVLMDSIFGAEKHVLDMHVLVRHPERVLTSDKDFNDVIEYTLIYSKSKDFKMPKRKIEKTADKYQYSISTSSVPDETLILNGKHVEVFFPKNYSIEKKTANKKLLHRETIRGSIREKNSSGRFYVSYLEELINKFPNQTLFKVEGIGDDGLGYRFFELPKLGNKNGAYYQGMPTSSEYTLKPYANFIDFVSSYNNVNKEGIYEFRNGKKPEEFIKFYLDIFTQPNDIVLDFFMGSGTTQAVSMKMNRRFIGIEQMDYINTISVPRLQKVIEGEQGGISKEVNWSSGGSFVYAELMEKNRGFIQEIQEATTMTELNVIFERMKSIADLDFRVDLEKFEQDRKENLLSLNEQKDLLFKMIDKNQLYYNESNIDDEDIRSLISDTDYKFNKSFYGE